jgi:hypothetical protein
MEGTSDAAHDVKDRIESQEELFVLVLGPDGYPHSLSEDPDDDTTLKQLLTDRRRLTMTPR